MLLSNGHMLPGQTRTDHHDHRKTNCLGLGNTKAKEELASDHTCVPRANVIDATEQLGISAPSL